MTGTPTLCLWYDRNAEEAATFYAATFPDTHVGAVQRAPGDYPDGHKGDALTVEFTVMGLPCVGLNGGPHFKHSEAFSFMVPTDCSTMTPAFAATRRTSSSGQRLLGSASPTQRRNMTKGSTRRDSTTDRPPFRN